MAGTKIALRFLRLSVCLSVRPHLSRAQYNYYVIRYYATAVYSSFWRFAGQAIANEGSLCCLDGENVVGIRKDPGFLAYSYWLEAHDKTAESALSL